MGTLKMIISIVTILLAVACGKQNKTNGKNADSLTTPNVNEINTSSPSAGNGMKKYPIKSGIVTFENDMMGIKQKSVLYFNDYGMKEAEEKYDGENLKETALCDGKKRYTIIHKEKTAYSAGDCFRGVAYRFDWEEISQARSEYKVKKLPDRTVASINCESYSLESGNFPTIFAGWKHILLYQETKSAYGTVIIKAVKVETDVVIPAGKLEIPAGYTLK